MMARLPPPKRTQVKKVRKQGRMAIRSNPIPSYQACVKVVCKRRYLIRPNTTNLDNMFDAFQVPVSPRALCLSVAMVTDDASNPSVAHGLYAAVKLLHVSMYYTPPVMSSTGFADAQIPLYGYSISITPGTTNLDVTTAMDQVSDTVTGASQIARVSWTPNIKNYPTAATFQAASSDNTLCTLRGFPGAIVDIMAEYLLSDGSNNVSWTYKPSGAVVGNMGFFPLDIGVSPGSRAWHPMDGNLVFE